MHSILIRLFPYALGIAVGLLGGFKLTQNHYQAAISKIETVHAQAQAKAAANHIDALRAERALSNVLSNSLSNAEIKINQLTLEKTRAIPKYTTGGVCFSADLTSLLNTPFDNLATTYLTPISSFTENAAAAAIESLTDEDVAYWIANAQGQYETCRVRLNTLIDYELGLIKND